MALKSAILRIALELPKGDPTRRKLLGELSRQAVDFKRLVLTVAEGLDEALDDLVEQSPDDADDVEHYVGNVSSTLEMLYNDEVGTLAQWKSQGLSADDIMYESSVSRRLTDRLIDSAGVRRPFDTLYRELKKALR